MRLRSVTIMAVLLTWFLCSMQIYAQEKMLFFPPLKPDEVLFGETDLNTTGEVVFSKKRNNENERILGLGITADFGIHMFDNNKKALVLIDDRVENGVDDLWFIDGDRGYAKVILKSTVIYNISDDGNFLCYYDHQNIMRTKNTLKIVLYDLHRFTVLKEYYLTNYSSVFWTYDVNDNEKKELPSIQYNSGKQVFTFRLVNSERYAVQFEIDPNTLEIKQVAISKEKVHMW